MAVGHTILQYAAGDALRVEPLGHHITLVIHTSIDVASTGADYNSLSRSLLLIGLVDVERSLGNRGDNAL